jgi:hypothetical protein
MARGTCPLCGLVHEPDPDKVTQEGVSAVLDEIDAAIEVGRRTDLRSWRYLDDLSLFALRIREHLSANWPPDRSVRNSVGGLLYSFSRDPPGGDLQYRFEKLHQYLFLLESAR